MKNGIRLFGHPVHPMLVVFPLALLPAGVLFDVAYALTGDTTFAVIGFWNIGLGIVGGLAAGIAGAMDWWVLARGSRARWIAQWHGLGNLAVILMFVLSWLIRVSQEFYIPGAVSIGLEVVALALAVVTAWLGGELVYRMGVAVDAPVSDRARLEQTGRPGTSTEMPSPGRPSPARQSIDRPGVERPS